MGRGVGGSVKEHQKYAADLTSSHSLMESGERVRNIVIPAPIL